MISYVYMYAIFSDLEKLKKQVNNQHQQDTHLLLGRRLTLTLILTPGYRMGCDENADPMSARLSFWGYLLVNFVRIPNEIRQVKEMKKISKGTYYYHFIEKTFLSKECLPLQINMTIIDDDLNSAKWLKYMYRVNMWRTIIAIIKLQFHILVVLYQYVYFMNTMSYVQFYCKWISSIDSAANFSLDRPCPTLFS